MFAKNEDYPSSVQITYSLPDLISRASAAEGILLSERVVRQYIDEGLLPPPGPRGSIMPYCDDHLDQLRLVVRLAGQYVPAREIQRFMSRLSPDALRALLDRPMPARTPTEGDVQAYLARLTRGLPGALSAQGLFSGALAATRPASSRPSMVSALPRGVSQALQQPARVEQRPRVVEDESPTSVSRSPWIHVSVDADVEIHVRANGHDQKRLVDSLIAAVQEVLAAERGVGL